MDDPVAIALELGAWRAAAPDASAARAELDRWRVRREPPRGRARASCARHAAPRRRAHVAAALSRIVAGDDRLARCLQQHEPDAPASTFLSMPIRSRARPRPIAAARRSAARAPSSVRDALDVARLSQPSAATCRPRAASRPRRPRRAASAVAGGVSIAWPKVWPRFSTRAGPCSRSSAATIAALISQERGASRPQRSGRARAGRRRALRASRRKPRRR